MTDFELVLVFDSTYSTNSQLDQKSGFFWTWNVLSVVALYKCAPSILAEINILTYLDMNQLKMKITPLAHFKRDCYKPPFGPQWSSLEKQKKKEKSKKFSPLFLRYLGGIFCSTSWSSSDRLSLFRWAHTTDCTLTYEKDFSYRTKIH